MRPDPGSQIGIARRLDAPPTALLRRRARWAPTPRLAAVGAMRGAALLREQPNDLRRLMIGKPEPIAKCPELVALFRADRSGRQDAVDRYLELAAALVQLLREAGREQAGRQGDHADADDPDQTATTLPHGVIGTTSP